MWITKFYRRKLFLLLVFVCLVLSIANTLLGNIPDSDLDNVALDLHEASEFDPRSITYSFYAYILSSINSGARVETSTTIGDADGVFFHWDDWVDLSPGQKILNAVRESPAPAQCGAALEKFSLVNPYYMESFNKKVLRGMANLYCVKDIPNRIFAAVDNGFIEVPVSKKYRVGSNALPKGISKDKLVKEMERTQDVTVLQGLVTKFHPYKPLRKTIDVDPEDFVFNIDNEILSMKKSLKEGTLSKSEISHLDFLEEANRLVESSDRFFKYPWIYSDLVAGRSHHLVFPFFKRYISTRERQSIIQHMVRTWFKFAETVEVVTWVNWGSLLGWAFNGNNMPWDTDLDIQIPIAQLDRLAREYNSTLILENPRDGNAKYLLEISPTYVRQGNGRNFIDARFIEINSGLYIDISALAHTGDEPPSDIFDVVPSDYKRKAIAVHCKNWNWHLLQELLPIRHTYFEDSSVYIPHNVSSILNRKYGASSYITALSFAGHHFRKDLLLWVPDEESSASCTLDSDSGSLSPDCASNWVKDEFLIIREAANRHKLLNMDIDKPVPYAISDYKELNLTRKDPWDYFEDISTHRVDNGNWYFS